MGDQNANTPKFNRVRIVICLIFIFIVIYPLVALIGETVDFKV